MTVFKWNIQYQELFEKLKKALTSSKILVFLLEGKQFILDTDTSVIMWPQKRIWMDNWSDGLNDFNNMNLKLLTKEKDRTGNVDGLSIRPCEEIQCSYCAK
ncbi:hypothetical protein HZH66_006967 [Vespula vulgaris]|uniref:Uncharacterized protein n=1 Tax=Vespula vulgaris TaxID=7454 RepID=A0A834K3C5_VESVU|nr:hypothetical protein HZH66_006967 [Vespula vulgaris]